MSPAGVGPGGCTDVAASGWYGRGASTHPYAPSRNRVSRAASHRSRRVAMPTGHGSMRVVAASSTLNRACCNRFSGTSQSASAASRTVR